MGEAISQVKRTSHKLQQSMQREPTPEEIADAMGMSPNKVRRTLEADASALARDAGAREGEVAWAISSKTIGSSTFTDAAAGSDAARADRRGAQKLPERERKIIQLRYGLKDGRYRTLPKRLGVEFGITRASASARSRRWPCVSCAITRTWAKKLRGYLD
ncbi:MAG: sigma-70 domain-containing protein [Kouleothrix sp.]